MYKSHYKWVEKRLIMADTKGLTYEEMKKANDEQEKAFLESDELREILEDLDLLDD